MDTARGTESPRPRGSGSHGTAHHCDAYCGRSGSSARCGNRHSDQYARSRHASLRRKTPADRAWDFLDPTLAAFAARYTSLTLSSPCRTYGDILAVVLTSARWRSVAAFGASARLAPPCSAYASARFASKCANPSARNARKLASAPSSPNVHASRIPAAQSMTPPPPRRLGIFARPNDSSATDRGRRSTGRRARIDAGAGNGGGGSPSAAHARRKKRTLPYPEFQHASSVASGLASQGSYSTPALNDRYRIPHSDASAFSHVSSLAIFHGSYTLFA